MDKIWYNRALVYYHFYDKDPAWIKEFAFCRKEAGIIKPYEPKIKEDEEIGNIQ